MGPENLHFNKLSAGLMQLTWNHPYITLRTIVLKEKGASKLEAIIFFPTFPYFLEGVLL